MTDYEILELEKLIGIIKYKAKELLEMPVYKEQMQARTAYMKLKEAVLWIQDIEITKGHQDD